MKFNLEITSAENGFVISVGEKTAVVQGKDSPTALGEAIFAALGIESKTPRKPRSEGTRRKIVDRLVPDDLPI